MSLPSVGLLGHQGRMGQRVLALMSSEFKHKAELTALVGPEQSTDALLGCDVVIDFASPEAAANLASKIVAARKGPGLVIASTGWTTEQKAVLNAATKFVPALVSSNFSLGVLALMEILKGAAPLLQSLGYEPVLSETHHRHKKDAPSGTAISLQRIIRPDAPHSVQTHSTRAGEVIGDHEISFYGPSDVIRLGHSAQTRDIFARGAIEAALWLAAKVRTDSTPPGIISIDAFFSDLKAAKASV